MSIIIINQHQNKRKMSSSNKHTINEFELSDTDSDIESDTSSLPNLVSDSESDSMYTESDSDCELELDDEQEHPPFTDCLVLISHSENITSYVLYDSVYDRYVIRGKNTEMDTEFAFNCNSKSTTLLFLKTIFEGMFYDGNTAHTLTNYTTLPKDCNEISYYELYHTDECGHLCVISKVTTKTLKLIDRVYNDY